MRSMVLRRLTTVLAGTLVGILFTGGIGFAADTLKIGVAGPHSGELATYGIPTLRAAEMAIRDANEKGGILGKKLVPVVEDDLCLPEAAAAAAARLVRENVPMVLGHICSGATKAALEIYRNANVIVMSPSATYPALTQSGRYPNFFRTADSIEAQARLAVDFALDTPGIKKIAVLYDEGDYGKGQAAFIHGFAGKDVRADIVFSEGITTGAVHYAEVVRRIQESGADAVIFSGDHPEAAKIVTEMRKEKITTDFIADDGVKAETFIQMAGKYAEGVYVIGSKDVSRNRLAVAADRAYRKGYGADPGVFFLHAYTGAIALLNAIEKSGASGYAALKNALHTEPVETPFGRIRFDDKGDAVGMGFSVYQVQQGAFVEIR